VLIPAILCPTVAQAILRAGHRPIIVDTNKDLHISPESIPSENSHDAKAILIPHLYGMSAPIASLLDWAAAHKLHVIDDAAQAAGISVDGKPLGTFGNLGILSFGPFKSVASTRGGALLSKDSLLIEKCRMLIGAPEDAPGAVFRILGCFAKLHFPRAIRFIKSSFSASKHRKLGSERSPAATLSSTSGDELAASSLLECALAGTLFARSATIVQNRSKTARQIFSIVEEYTGLAPIGVPGTPFMSIPIRLKNNLSAEEAIDRLREIKIEATRIYRPLHLFQAFSEFAAQPLERSLESWNRVVLLPNPARCRIPEGYSQLRRGLDMIGAQN
jgi:dTDP-4-amino-4,6-dideoxygalactose transaminase